MLKNVHEAKFSDDIRQHCCRRSRRLQWQRVAGNVYFELTRVFNEHGPIVALASGQAVVHYRVAIMSKDGDWVIRETDDACARVLDVLAARGASYRPGAPLDTRWLAGGWSSHFEYTDERKRRIRCDFFSRPPRIDPEVEAFSRLSPEDRRLRHGHERVAALADQLLPRTIALPEGSDVDAQ